MIVYYKAADEFGCGHYRVYYPFEALLEDGVDVRLISSRIEPGDDVVVVLQRPMDREVSELTIPYLQSRGYAVVVEVDDDLSHLEPTHGAWAQHQPQYSPDVNFRWLEAAAAQADLVTCTTKALAEVYAPHGRVMVIPNYIPRRKLATNTASDRNPDGPYVMGWPGVVSTHPGDLDAARRAVLRALQEPGWRFRALGSRETLVALGIADGDVQEWVPISEYHQTLQGFDLGIVPLKINRFNSAKSQLKGLEYSAAGVPFVATATQPYQELHKMGAGLLIEDPKDWRKVLPTLVRSPALRAELAEAGLEVARANTIEGNVWRWQEAFREARLWYEGRSMSPEALAMRGRRVEVVV